MDLNLIPNNENEIEDMDLFNALDLTTPGLEDVKASLFEGDIERAKKALVGYFETRNNVMHFFDFRDKNIQPIDRNILPYMFQASLGLKENIKDFALKAADLLMDNKYIAPGGDNLIWDFGPGFKNAMHYNMYTDRQKSNRACFSLFTRTQFLEYLMFKYHETKDQAVLDKYSEVLRFFFDTYPLKVEEFSVNAGHLMYTEDRDVMDLGWLCFVYTEMLYTRMSYNIDTKLTFELIKHLWFCGMQFRRFDDDKYTPYNHHYFERGIVPFFLSVMFPEIPAFREMRDKAVEVCSQHILEDYNEDGGYNELSIAYWFGAAIAEMLYRNIVIADLNSCVFLTDEMQERINKTMNVFYSLIIAGDYLPSIGDNSAPLINPMLELAYQMTHEEKYKDLLDFRTGKRSTLSCNEKYYANDKVGLVIARNEFSDSANGMIMSAKVNCGISGHNHMDMLSLVTFLRGKPFVAEPYAGELYHKYKMRSIQRGYCYNMDSHNTVLCYSRPIEPWEEYSNLFGIYRPDSPISEFKEYKNGMYVAAYHYGYTFCSHERRVLFTDNGNMLVKDLVNRGNRVDRDHKQRWNLEPKVKVTKLSDSALRLERDGIKCLWIFDRAKKIEIFKQTEILSEYYSDDEIGFTIDASFAPVSNFSHDKTMLVTLSTLMLDITEYNGDINIDALKELTVRLSDEIDKEETIDKLSSIFH